MAVVATLDDLKIGDIVTWFHHSNIVPANVISAEVIGFSSGTNLVAPAQAAVNHANIYPAIPQGNVIIPDNFQLYEYIIIKQQSGIDNSNPLLPVPIYTVYEIGKPWIVPTSITRHNRETLVLQIEDFDIGRLDAIIRILKNNGFMKYSYEILGE